MCMNTISRFFQMQEIYPWLIMEVFVGRYLIYHRTAFLHP